MGTKRKIRNALIGAVALPVALAILFLVLIGPPVAFVHVTGLTGYEVEISFAWVGVLISILGAFVGLSLGSGR